MKRNSVKKYAIEYNGLIGKERERFHPTQKPTALIAAILVDYSTESDLIIDFWSGSGTTMVAAEQTGRICYGCDIEPKYVAVALERMAGMGLEPRLLEPEHTMALQEAII